MRNVQVTVSPRCDGSAKYNYQTHYKLQRHVSKLIVIVPVNENQHVVDQHQLAGGDVHEDVLESSQEESNMRKN